MGSSVNVVIYDQAPDVVAKVEAFAAQYKYGSFDAMQDLYEYSNVNKKLPQAKYVFVRNELSDELKQNIWNFARGFYDQLQDAPADQKQANSFWIKGWNMNGGELIWKLASGNYNWDYYWNSLKEKAAA